VRETAALRSLEPARLLNRIFALPALRHWDRVRGTILPAAIALLATFFAIDAAQAQTFSVIYNFGSYGAHPTTGLTIDAGGNLYGTTSRITGDAGTVFKLSRRGTGWILSPLYEFQGNLDGSAPTGRPVFGPGGLLYGPTGEGGGPGCENYGCGTVYSLRPAPRAPADIISGWQETILYRFTGGPNGSAPIGDLLFDSAGTMYGVDGTGSTGWGAVYSLRPGSGLWSLKVLYDFTDGPDGGGLSGVIFDGQGRLYGATSYGGAHGNGTIFRLTPSEGGWTQETLYDFEGAGDGAHPWAPLIFDAAGNLYGTTLYGGSGGGGTVFMLSQSPGGWALTGLYSFTGGAGSFGSLARGAAGNLYGTTFADGAYGFGNVFKLSPSNGSWTYTSLHDFTGGDDGSLPDGGVILDSAGNLYGTTENGGEHYNNGVVFEITPQ
jgi:uncharacterized repeat protein (TIGR03803 family)